MLATSNCHLTGNTCDTNANAGLAVTGTGNRVDGNSCTSNTFDGFEINSTKNFVVRNSGHGNNPNFFIPAGNAPGPIVDMAAGGTITSTSPWANFSY
jgi:parallel beta-helix repeat protein